METSNSNLSESNARDSILNNIINCANCALQNEDAFQKAMLSLAKELRTVFDSEYCSIGIVDGNFAEDFMTSYEEFKDEQLSKQQKKAFASVKRVNINENNYTVCQALKSKNDIFFYQEKIDQFNNYQNYLSILSTGVVLNSCVIPIRDDNNNNYGFIQFINIKKNIDFNRDLKPYRNAFLGLVQIIINNQKNQQELISKANRLKDADFYNLMQDKRNNVDDLLDSIMEYFSKEFNAAIISFRIPILNGYQKEPIFYLRRCYIHDSIEKENQQKLFKSLYIKSVDQMSGIEDIICGNQGQILISRSKTDYSEFELDENTLFMPIFHNFDLKCKHLKTNSFCKKGEKPFCKERFEQLYGIFRLRIKKTKLSDPKKENQIDFNEIKQRLSYLSRQITLLLNSIVDKYENESLEVFQDELKNSLFIKIQDFDERCVNIIKKIVHAKICSIYRYDDRSKLLTMSATTAKIIYFKSKDNDDLYFESEQIKDSCFVHAKATDNVLTQAVKSKSCIYVLNIKDKNIHQSPFIEFIKNDQESAIAIPMIKKDGTCAGVVLLLGKEEHKQSISTSYWEHDIQHIEFIVNILTRISESDTERLTFLSQLSHELLDPVTELVLDNDYTINIAERNLDSFTKRQLIAKIRENLDRNMFFKYIIDDTKFIYSSTGKSIDYKIVKQDKPQEILLDAIRLMEKEAHESKGLSIITYISQMPALYFDKERMMQVFLNLLKNAIRYADKHTQISISYNKRDDGSHEIRFANIGIGIPKEEEDSIFELFHRGEAAKKRFPRGTGMGLYIVKDIMKAHGGDCYVSHSENPTEFAIILPDKEKNENN